MFTDNIRNELRSFYEIEEKNPPDTDKKKAYYYGKSAGYMARQLEILCNRDDWHNNVLGALNKYEKELRKIIADWLNQMYYLPENDRPKQLIEDSLTLLKQSGDIE